MIWSVTEIPYRRFPENAAFCKRFCHAGPQRGPDRLFTHRRIRDVDRMACAAQIEALFTHKRIRNVDRMVRAAFEICAQIDENNTRHRHTSVFRKPVRVMIDDLAVIIIPSLFLVPGFIQSGEILF